MSVIELLPEYMGKTVLERCKSTERVQTPDFSHCGEVFAAGSMVLEEVQVYLAVNMRKGALSIYESKPAFDSRQSPQHVIPFTDVYGVKECTPELFSDSAKHFFIVVCRSNTLKFYTCRADTTNEWIFSLRNSIQHCQVRKIGLPLEVSKTDYSPPEMPAEWGGEDTEGDDSQELDAEMSQRESVNFSSFTIQHELGSGAFGTVYKVVKTGTSRIYAMKCLSKKYLTDRNQLEYSISECKILRSLDHPFIVKLHFAFQTSKSLYMVLDYCPNGDLLTHLSERKRFSESVVRFYCCQVLLALEYLHSLDIVYRDLKPENLLIDRAGNLRLVDFGLAKENVNEMNPATTFCGSPAYLAPEILEKQGSEKSADVYSFGALLFELLAGSPPFYSDNLQSLYRNIKNSSLEFPTHIKPVARDVIRKLLQREPGKRPAISQVKSHPFFRGVDWAAVYAMSVRPPRLGPAWKQVDESGQVIEFDLTLAPQASVDEESKGDGEVEGLISEFNF